MTQLIILTDTHIGRLEMHQLSAGIKHARAMAPTAPVVIAGDLTNGGRPEEFERLWAELKEGGLDAPAAPPFVISPPAKGWTEALLTLGNHDVRGPVSRDWSNDPFTDPTYLRDSTMPLYDAYYMTPRRQQTPYFAQVIGDLQIIMLCGEKGLKDSAYYSSTQLQWLDRQLAAGLSRGLHSLVFTHQPLRDTVWGSNVYGGIGMQDGVLKALLARYPDTLILSGHVHNGFGVAEAVPRPFGTCIDLPAYGVAENGRAGWGIGYLLTSSPTEWHFAAWDFAADDPTELTQFDLTFPTRSLATAVAAFKAKNNTDPRVLQGEMLLNREYDQAVCEDPATEDEPHEPPAPLYGPTTWQQISDLIASGHVPAPSVPQDAFDWQGFNTSFAPRDTRLAQLAALAPEMVAPTADPAQQAVLRGAAERVQRVLKQSYDFGDAAVATDLAAAKQALAWVKGASSEH